MTHHITTGALGERLAAGYLLAKGFTILHKNWRHSHWEVDVIASGNNVLIELLESFKLSKVIQHVFTKHIIS